MVGSLSLKRTSKRFRANLFDVITEGYMAIDEKRFEKGSPLPQAQGSLGPWVVLIGILTIHPDNQIL